MTPNVDELQQEAGKMSAWQQHRFMVLVVGVIMISLFMVSIALSIYNSSGAALLDLSRPGYQSVRDQAIDSRATSYPSSGPLDAEALDEFEKMYDERTSKVIDVDSFDASALSEESLQLLSNTRADGTANN